MKSKVFFLLLLLISYACCRDEEKIEPVRVGNLALPSSQQPGPLIGFGQNIIDQGDLQVFNYVDCLKGIDKKFTEVAPSILYGIRQDLSIFIEFPVAAKFQLNSFYSRGMEDMLIQFEYALYDNSTLTYMDQITLVTSAIIPTGSPFKELPTGFGSPGFFLGFTANHLATEWYYFISGSATLTTTHQRTKFGDQFLYQFGLARNISYSPDSWIFTAMIELDGIYRQRNRILGITDQNSGGNEILFGPSLWFSTQHLIVQAGISWVVSQQLFGIQNKDTYYAAFNIGWKFH